MVSRRHANFLINTGGATAADIEGLGEEVRRRVYEMTGVVLEWEIRRVGRSLPELAPIVENDRYPPLSARNPHGACAPPAPGTRVRAADIVTMAERQGLARD